MLAYSVAVHMRQLEQGAVAKEIQQYIFLPENRPGSTIEVFTSDGCEVLATHGKFKELLNELANNCVETDRQDTVHVTALISFDKETETFSLIVQDDVEYAKEEGEELVYFLNGTKLAHKDKMRDEVTEAGPEELYHARLRMREVIQTWGGSSLYDFSDNRISFHATFQKKSLQNKVSQQRKENVF